LQDIGAYLVGDVGEFLGFGGIDDHGGVTLNQEPDPHCKLNQR